MRKRTDYAQLPTEAAHPRARKLETLPVADIVQLMLQEERRALRGALAARAQIVAAVALTTRALQNGGRIFYVGAGTSGRLGALDAAELPPTFGSDPRQVQAIMAGGKRALSRAVEGAEDRASHAERRLAKLGLDRKDVVIAIAASGVTPFARRALEYARRVGAGTVFVTFAADSAHDRAADVVISCAIGPEVLAGSTRLKAGTATKLILNAISTATMVKLGKVYSGRMVDLRASTTKLRWRAERMVAELCHVDAKTARSLLRRAAYHPKVAIAMHQLGIEVDEATARLRKVHGDLHRVLAKR